MPFAKVSISEAVKELADFKPEYVTLTAYEAHPQIKAELTVAGLRSLNNKPAGTP